MDKKLYLSPFSPLIKDLDLMKRIPTLVCMITLVLMVGCSPKITSNFINTQPELAIDEKVALLDLDHALPDSVVKVGDLRYQDSMFSTDCGFNSLMNQARMEARKNGANIVKVIDKKKPDLWSSCYRLKIELYKYEGDVATLPQYQLKLE